MFDNTTVGDYIIDLVRGGVIEFLNGKYVGLFEAVHGFISIALILSIVIYGVRFMAADISGTPKKLIITILGVFFAIGITEPSFYFEWVIKPVYTIRDNLFSFIASNGDSGTVFESISSNFDRMYRLGDNMVEVSGITNLKPLLMGAIIWLVYGVYYALLVGVTAFCEMAIGVIICLGVLIIPLSAFECGRGLGKSWLVALAKYTACFVVISFIVALVDGINTNLVNALMINIKGDVENTDSYIYILGATLLVGLFGALLMLKSMDVAAEITGGVTSDAAGGVSALSNTAGAAFKGMGAIGKPAAGAGIKALKNKFGA